MIYPLHEGAIQIDRVHRAAICEEIGERLHDQLKQPIRLPRRLLGLLQQLRDDDSRNSARPIA